MPSCLEPRCLLWPDHHRIGLQLYVEAQFAGVLQDLKAIAPQQRLPPLMLRKNVPHSASWRMRILDLGGAHLVFAFVIEIAVDATLVALPRDVNMRAQRNALLGRLAVHLFKQTHGTSSLGNRMIRDN